MQRLDSSPGLRRPGRSLTGVASTPTSNLTPSLPASGASGAPKTEKSEKFDQYGANETEFTEKVVEFRDGDWPEDWKEEPEEEYDENGMNFLHYCIVKGYGEAINELLDNMGFDANTPTQSDGASPLMLALRKCRECLQGNARLRPFLAVAIKLLDSDAEVNEAVMKDAVNFPKVLVDILRKNLNYYKPAGGGTSQLTRAIRSGFDSSFNRMGFVELVLRQNADTIIIKLITEDPNFLKKYTNSVGETPLHSAVKVGKVEITQLLMQAGIGEQSASDRNHRTPIVTALVNHEQLKDLAPQVIMTILSHLPASEAVTTLQHTYRGMPVIEYDIKSGIGVIVKGILLLEDTLCKELLLERYKFSNHCEGNILHIAARHGFPLTVFRVSNKLFLEYFDEIDSNKSKKLPCDYAVEFGHTNFLEEVWEIGREEWSGEIRTACECGNLDALLLLRSKSRDPPTEENNRNLLYLACKKGQASIVEFFLETVKVSPTRLDTEKDKPSMLMVASDADAADCVTLLLDHNASVYDRDDKDYSALCRAILLGKKKAVMAILTHPVHGEHALNYCTGTNETPMRLLVINMTDVAKWVLNKQIKQTGHDEIEYDYDLIDDFERTECEFIGPLGYLYRKFGGHKPEQTTDGPSELSSNYLRLGRDSPVPGKRQKPNKFEPENHMLHLMVKSKSLDILNHKLVENLINHYWRYVIWQWIALRSVYLFITVMLTVFTLVLPHPKDDICISTNHSGISDGRRAFLIFSSITLILSSLLSLAISAYTLYIAKLGIFHQQRFRVLFEIILAILILLFVIGYGNDEWCSQDWQWNVGAFCTCLSWLTLLVTLKGFRHTAPPINMLFAIIKNFLWIIYVPILLIAAFVLPFYMLFHIPGQNFGPYEDFGSTFGSVAILFTGDGEYGDQFTSEESVVNFPFASYCIYYLFVIMVGILFNNLLVSLAVGEVDELQDNATLEHHRLNVEGIIDGLEAFFPFIPRKEPDKFELQQEESNNDKYFKAEAEFKRADADSNEFADSVLKDTSEEILQSKIDQLEAALSEKTEMMQKSQEEMKEKMEELLNLIQNTPRP
ncbi:transient receptor potential cation channel subfamily A member 1-like isoform X2 [Dysidea avara]